MGSTNSGSQSGFGGASFQYFDGRQGLAFDEFEERSAAGRDIGNPVGDAIFGDRGQCVAAAGYRKRAAVCDRFRHNFRTATERINSQATDLGIERPKLRNGAAVANLNTLIYALINLRALQRVQAKKRTRSS